MSIQPESDLDLDRTDVLPALDVEAYEARLAAQGDTLVSTDKWVVPDLREAEDLHEESAPVRFSRSRPKARELPPAPDVTVEATRILERIRELETELADARARENELMERVDQLTQELASRDKQTQALQADNERLAEQRSIVVERVHALERQLQDEAARADREIAELRQQVASEERNSSELARHLAAKIAEHARMNQEIARRDATINALTAVRDELSAQLEDARAGAAAIEDRHADRIRDLERELDDNRSGRETLTSELAEARARLQQLEADLDERDRALRVAEDQAANLRRTNATLEHELETSQARLEELEGREVSIQRLQAELQLSQDERAIMAGQLEKSRTRNRAMAREIFLRDNEIASLKADIAVHVEALAAIRQDVSRTATAALNEHPTRILEPIGHDAEAIVLDKKIMTVGRTSDNDICLSSKLVSRNHARLLVGPNAVIVEDAGSTNGCCVNDVPVKQQLVREGDVLAIGDLKFRLRTRGDTTPRARDNVIPFQ